MMQFSVLRNVWMFRDPSMPYMRALIGQPLKQICHLTLYDVSSYRRSSGLSNQCMFITLCLKLTSLRRLRWNKYVPITILLKKIGLHSFLQKERGVSILHCNLIKKKNKVLIFKINTLELSRDRCIYSFYLY